jgi:hypothetical protein
MKKDSNGFGVGTLVRAVDGVLLAPLDGEPWGAVRALRSEILRLGRGTSVLFLALARMRSDQEKSVSSGMPVFVLGYRRRDGSTPHSSNGGTRTRM